MLKPIQSIFVVVLFFALISFNLIAQPPDFTAYNSENPVVPKGGSGAWDNFATWAPGVTVVNDTFYLTYNGTSNFQMVPIAIGLAISSDGYDFTKYPSNPILTGDGSGFDASVVNGGRLYFENGIWYLYYAGRSTLPNFPGNVIGRATASNPRGPWTTTDDTLLTVGSAGEWDSIFILPSSIIKTVTELMMFYWGGNIWPGGGHQIGLATSTDGGLTWTKYDDPTTTTPPYAESDPVLKVGAAGSYDDYLISGCSILKTSTQWEMFYSGNDGDSSSICYATSSDGIVWDKDSSNNPIFTPAEDPLATVDVLEVPSILLFNGNYHLYYDYGVFADGIGLATADTGITSIKPLFGKNPSTFELYQNHPNPFNPTTNIEFSLPQAEFVTLKVYNILGEEMTTLASETLTAGKYKYEWDASGLANGIYLYQIKGGDFTQVRKMVLIK